ncbi:MAG: type II secretion system protein [Elusimicrobiota bacterium]
MAAKINKTFMRRTRSGVSLLEMIIYVAIISIAIVAFAKYFAGFTKTTRKADNEMRGSFEMRLLMSRVENDLYEANQMESVLSGSMTFRCDIVKTPGYRLDGDFDGDGVANIKDTDDDNDASLKFSLPADQQWRAGYDLEDDDDDNDGQADARISLYYSPAERKVYRSLYVNGGASDTKELAARISSFTLTCYGSKREDLGRNIDRGSDGLSGTGDAGEEDGIISEREIDWVQPPAGHGNRSGRVDTVAELKYVTSVAIYAEADANADGKPDSMLGTEIMPPLLALKRRR